MSGREQSKGIRAGGRIVALVAVIALVAGVILVVRDGGDRQSCARVSETDLQETIADGVDWMARALHPDGTFWYEYDRATDSFADAYHIVRHAGAVMALYQIAAADGDASTEALELGDGGLVFLTDRVGLAEDRAAIREPRQSAILGSSALTVAGLVHRRRATGDRSHDELMRGLGRFMLSLLRADGGMWAGATGPALDPQVGTTSTFYTGEAFWAFALLADMFPEEGWDQAARAVGQYLATARDLEERIEDPPHPDQWAAYGFSAMRDQGSLDASELAYVRALADRYQQRLRRETAREAERIGDGTDEPDESVVQARGAGFGTTVEALGSLWELSLTDPGMADLTDELRLDLICGASILAARQYDDDRASEWARPDVVTGAWFDEHVTRVDDQQHALSGVLLALPALAARAGS